MNQTTNDSPQSPSSNSAEIALLDLWKVILRHWKWFCFTPPTFIVLTALILLLFTPRWGASYVIQIGQINLKSLEPQMRMIDRIKQKNFRDAALLRARLNQSDADIGSDNKFIQVRPLSSGDLVEVEVQSFSKDSAKLLAQATFEELHDTHKQIFELRIRYFNEELERTDIELDRLQRLLETRLKKSSGDSLAEAVLLSQISTETLRLRNRKFELQDQLSQSFSSKLFTGIETTDKPIWPKKPLFIGVAAFVGFALSFLIAIVLNSNRSR